ncbi:helicase RepA family protein [Paracoccaceae bacterium]|nr:helicase RepA family protein [Paracoccaceae bacterium]
MKGAPQLIIIDTLARHMGGLDENNAKDMVKLILTADKLKDDYQCAVMLVHHTGHSHQDRARGSIAFKGALDTEIIVNQLGDYDLTTRCEKQKDGTPFELRQLVKVSVEPSIILQQIEATKKVGTSCLVPASGGPDLR